MPDACRVCGCTEENPCVHPLFPRGCQWIEADLCSACAAIALGLRELGLLNPVDGCELPEEPAIVIATEQEAELLIRKMRAAGA